MPPNSNICPTDPSKPLLEPEALAETNDASDDPSAATAQQLTDGSGVTVGFIADGIDPDSPDFIRADGTHVIVDYQQFSSNGASASAGGEEAYGDASSIGAQGLVSHDLSDFVNPAYPLPAGCDIRILGMAPEANLVALNTDFSTLSIIEAIDYAVSTDHVDVLNESFDASLVPDASVRQAITLFDDMAVAAGTTVTVSSGDAGTTSTIGSPATDPNVISVAATTTEQGVMQTGYAGSRTFSNGTWTNDEISSFSSGGFTESGGTVDLAAPGDTGWAACDPSVCGDYAGTGSSIQLFGGTSQSAPLTAGAAALVISAYRSTHGGGSPTPAVVKTLLVSTATDLGLPTFEQGAGLLDARAAVEAALTYPGATTGAPADVASHIALSTTQLNWVGAAGSSHTATVGVTDVGDSPLTVDAGTRDLSQTGVDTQTVTLDPDNDPTFPYPTNGTPYAYATTTFDVPSGTDRAAIQMAWAGNGNRLVRLTVIDPSGSFVTNSRPQGYPDYANVDVREPHAGTYTAILYTQAGSPGFSGQVQLRETMQQDATIGQVTPATLSLKPGQSKNIKVTIPTPASGGDVSYAVTVANSDGHQTALPVVIRTLVPTPDGSGTFSGAITGGNGRSAIATQTFAYAFAVPNKAPGVSVGVTLADSTYTLEGVLLDPNGEVQAADSNELTDAYGNVTGAGTTMQLTAAKPIPGRWRLVILVVNPVPGAALTENFNGTVKLQTYGVAPTGIPNSAYTKLVPGVADTAQIAVTNTGIEPLQVQLDPRTRTTQAVQLTNPNDMQTVALPGGDTPYFFVPPLTTSITATATSTVPAIVELTSPTFGVDVAGDLAQAQAGDLVSTATVSESHGHISSGPWFTGLQEVGADNPSGAPSGSSTVDLSATTAGFATDVTSSTGDFWALATNPSADTGTPLLIQPGQTQTITVTITPNAATGTAVSGTLVLYATPVFGFPTIYTTGDLLAQIPYHYTVGR